MEKLEIYSIEKVEERLSFYREKIKLLKDPAKTKTHIALFNFWKIYKLKNYPNAETSIEIQD